MRVRLAPLCASLLLVAYAAGAQEDRTRSVKIIESLPDATTAAPEVVTPPTTPPALSEEDQRADNPAGLAIEMIPGTEVTLGSQMSFRVTTEKQGYLVLVDIDSGGKLTQIYPNLQSLSDPQGMKDDANLIKRGKPKSVPDTSAKANFQFVASEPTGVGMVVAILSDKPVQMIDLPDIPAALAGQRTAVEFVRDNTRTLRILPADDRGRIEDPKWSFTTKFYVIR